MKTINDVEDVCRDRYSGWARICDQLQSSWSLCNSNMLYGSVMLTPILADWSRRQNQGTRDVVV